MRAVVGWMTLWLSLAGIAQAEPTAADLEFFEKSVRPILVEQCQKCHGARQQKGGLRLDSLGGAFKGGDTGPALVPGDPKQSLLIDAINYDPNGYQMPPTGKLSAEQIATLTEWVQRGAPWPQGTDVAAGSDKKFDLAERAKHWSFQPLTNPAPPDVQRPEWSSNPIDRFIASHQEALGLQPQGVASRRTLLRRVTFELTGLPPTVDEIDAFLADHAPGAYERLIDRLLASPRYGERWARHWLDLVRFAETAGHEFDYEFRHAWPYRDYVIRAWNADLPYDQFVREHIAGDLLPSPRRDPATHVNESVIGTGFYWFGQGKHSPVDLRAEECHTVDNQLDVLGKTFLGLTIACARCHDHKFDALTQKDYYALAGFLQSSRQTYADIAPPEPATAVLEELEDLTRRSQGALWDQSLAACGALIERLPELLLDGPTPAGRAALPAEFVAAWRKTLAAEALHDRGHPFHMWVHWAKSPDQTAERVRDWRQQPRGERPASNESLPSPTSVPEAWFYEGRAFRRADTRGLLPLWDGTAERPLRGLVSPDTWGHSGLTSSRLQGTLRSPTFTITKPYIDYLAHRRGGVERTQRGLKEGQIHLVIDGFQFIKNPLYGHLSQQIAQRETPQWYRQDVSKFVGQRAYIEIEDADAGEIVVERIALHDGERPLEPFHPLVTRQLMKARLDSLADVAQVYQQVCVATLEALRRELVYGARAFSADDAAAGASLVNWLCRQPLPPGSAVAPSPTATEYVARRQALDAQWPSPQYVLAMTDGSPEDEHLLIRGNAHKPGEAVPRRYLEVAALLPGASDAPCSSIDASAGSGRLQLAEAIVDPANPLTARVIVNRLWMHHFGRGLVPTPDDFGHMGQPPTHPELLDWLARELIRSDWSLKHIQWLLVTSQTYQMSSQAADAHAEELDPENKLLHRMNVQRLEAEAIRDTLLALSGRLDDRLYGPSVMPHLTPFMEGRGRPGQSGPLDGNGRRSVYINVRRNFLSPLFLAFDFPTPFTTMGRRSTSNVPAQALALMNNPFVVEQAGLWAERVLATTDDPAQRIDRLYLTAFGRPPTPDEAAAALAFVTTQAAVYGQTNDPRAWYDVAHVLWNVKELVFVE